MRKDHLHDVLIFGCQTYVENTNLSVPVQHNFSLDVNSRTNLTVPFRDITGMKLSTDLSPNQLALKIACVRETILICKEDTTPLMKCPVLALLTPL
ncbi:uncharacterized protein TNCV_2892531 [Trichonephila clavipes]|nr:uncharacterized protein TNCV_2892531 [Trichonephila clavipes]